MSHLCHAYECTTSVPPKMLMCLRHWRMVPKNLQAKVWQYYRPGQEIDKQPSQQYLIVQRGAVWCVAVAEKKCKYEEVPEIGTAAYMLGPAVLKRKSA